MSYRGYLGKGRRAFLWNKTDTELWLKNIWGVYKFCHQAIFLHHDANLLILGNCALTFWIVILPSTVIFFCSTCFNKNNSPRAQIYSANKQVFRQCLNIITIWSVILISLFVAPFWSSSLIYIVLSVGILTVRPYVQYTYYNMTHFLIWFWLTDESVVTLAAFDTSGETSSMHACHDVR